MERWLDQIPAELKTDIEPRLNSDRDDVACGALFELYVFVLFSSSCKELQLEVVPDRHDRSRPDFLVHRPCGKRFLLEATVYQVEPGERSEYDVCSRILGETTQYVISTGFRLCVEQFNNGHTTPSPKRLAQSIDLYLQELDWSDVVAAFEEGGIDAVKRRFGGEVGDSRAGTSFEVWPWPVNANTKPDRILVWSPPMYTGRMPSSVLRSVVDAKRRQHKRWDLPIVVAACCNDMPGDPSGLDVSMALYGDFAVHFNQPGGAVEARLRNGVWTRARSANRLHGVIATSCCLPWMIPNDHLCLWCKPGLRPDDVIPSWPYDSIWAEDGATTISEHRGKSVEDFLGEIGSSEPSDLYDRLE